MFQIRHDDGRAYAQGRDIVQLFPRLAQMACSHLGQGGWHPKVKAWADHEGLTQQDLQKAEIALAKFIMMSTTDKANTREDAWTNSGLAALHPAAMLMIFFFVGTVTLDSYLESVRQATRAGKAAWGAERMLDHVERLVHAGNAPTQSAQARRADEAAAAMAQAQSPNPYDN